MPSMAIPTTSVNELYYESPHDWVLPPYEPTRQAAAASILNSPDVSNTGQNIGSLFGLSYRAVSRGAVVVDFTTVPGFWGLTSATLRVTAMGTASKGILCYFPASIHMVSGDGIDPNNIVLADYHTLLAGNTSFGFIDDIGWPISGADYGPYLVTFTFNAAGIAWLQTKVGGGKFVIGFRTAWDINDQNIPASGGCSGGNSFYFKSDVNSQITVHRGAAIPIVETHPATGIGQFAATLNGFLTNDVGGPCACGFEWGATAWYGNVTPTTNQTTGDFFAQPIIGLLPNRTYHFRALATNAEGTAYGTDMSFTTPFYIQMSHALSKEKV